MRSYSVVPGQGGLAQQYVNLRHDAKGGGNLLVHQQLGAIALATNPTNGQTLTLTINGTGVVITFVSAIGTTAGNVLIGASAAATLANLLALLNQPQTTTSIGVSLSTADQQLLSYLSWPLSGTTVTPCSNNNSLYAPLTSFSASTTVTSGSWTAQTMQLYVEPGVVYINGTRVIFTGGSTPTVTGPVSNPRIDVLTVDNTGTLAWTTGTENSSPSAPTYPADKVALCELYNVVSETALYDSEDQQSGQGYISNDVRPFMGERMNWTAFASNFIPDADGTRNLGSPSYEWNNLYVKSGIFLNGAAFGSQLTFAATALETIAAGAPVAAGLAQTTDIGYDTSGESSSGTQSVTIGSNSNRGLFVIALGSGSSSTTPTIGGTFAGQSITWTNLTFSIGGNESTIAYGYLVAPPTGSGSFNVTATGGTSPQLNRIFWWSLYNCSQSSPVDQFSGIVVSGSSASTSVTTGVNGAFALGMLFGSSGGGSTIGTPTGIAYGANTASGSNPAYALGTAIASNIYPAGSTAGISTTGATSGNIYCATLTVQPANAPSIGVIQASSASITSPNTRCTGFLGFAVSSVTNGQTLTVVTNGVVGSLSGLVLGQEYYLNDTNGTIGTSAGSNTRKAGVAVSGTQLLITNQW